MIAQLNLIGNLAVALGAAFIVGFLAALVRLPPLVGYLLAGILVGPATPGPIADPQLAAQLADIGIILLMFGVGVRFSVRELLPVWRTAVLATVMQTGVLGLAGFGLARAWGWADMAGVALGFALSVSSTIVGLRALMERDLLDSTPGHLMVGWLLAEDLLTLAVLLLAPSFAAPGGSFEAAPWPQTVGLALLKVLAFGALMLLVGVRLVPWLLEQVARTGSRELFTLAVFALALGMAFASHAVFGLPLALGAFVAGLVVSESDLSHHAAAESLPLRDAFGVLFFVSVGMLLDPALLVLELGSVAVLLGLVVVFKPLTASLFLRLLGYSWRTALTVGAARGQVGEFTFLLGGLAAALGLISGREYNLLIATFILAVALNPLLFRAAHRLEQWATSRGLAVWPLRSDKVSAGSVADGGVAEGLRGHAVLCGYGRVGRIVAEALRRRGFPFVVIDQDRRVVGTLRRQGIRAIYGDAGRPGTLELAGVSRARVVIVAVSDPVVARRIVEHARRANRRVNIVARTHSGAESSVLGRLGADEVVLAELEVALEMARHTLRRFGVSPLEAQGFLQGLRASFGYLAAEERPGGP